MSATSSRKSRRTRSWSSLGWILGWLASVALLCWVCISWAVPHVERRLATEVQAAIVPATSSPVLVTVQGHVATLTGNDMSVAERDSVVAAALSTPGIRQINDQLTVVAEAEAEATNVATAGDDAVDQPGAVARNERSVAGDEPSQEIPDDPPPLLDPTATADADTGVEPETESLAENDIPDTAAPNDVDTAADVSASRPPELKLSVTNHTLTMTGQISEKDDLAMLRQAAMSSFDLDYVSNSIEAMDDVVAADWIEPLASLMPSLAGLQEPVIDIIDQQITISGSARDQQAHDTVVDEALQSLGVFSLVERISVIPDAGSQDADMKPADTTDTTDTTAAAVEAPAGEQVDTADTESAASTASQSAITESMQASMSEIDLTGILFEPSSDQLAVESLDLLDKVAEVLVQFPDVPVAIDGHTDASGVTADNLTLSQLRANRVRDHLVDQGVSVYRLKARGFGEGMPVQSNDTPEGRAANRRIEFTY